MKLFKNSAENTRMEIAQGLPAILPRLWRFAYSLCQSATTADDLVQDACVRALSKAAQFQSGSRLDAWTFTILRSIWLNNLRTRKIQQGAGVVPIEQTNIAAPSPDVETNIFANEVVTRVMLLPEAQRESVLLVYVEGFSYREASEILDVPIGTIMSRLSTARQKLAHLNDTSRQEGRK